MLLDSNIIIYAALPLYEPLRRFISEKEPAVSAMSYVSIHNPLQGSEPE